MENKQIFLAKRPKGMPTPDIFGIRLCDLPPLDGEQVLLQTLYISVDPYMRGRMREGKSYVEPFTVGEAMTGGVVGRVLESRAEDFKVGDFVMGNLPWQLYAVAAAEGLQKVDPNIAPISTALGILGMPGLTAYFGLLEIGEPKGGETVVVSGAAGAVGSVVGQIAKLKGARVVGIAGSEEKVRYLTDELKFDAALNYKSNVNLKGALQDACPQGVDVYFDNVGGPVSDAVMQLLNFKARIPLCGQISLYNAEKPEVGPRIQPLLLMNRAKMQGFIVFDFFDRYKFALMEMGRWVQEGKLTYKETIHYGFEALPEAFVGLFKGENIGKLLVCVQKP